VAAQDMIMVVAVTPARRTTMMRTTRVMKMKINN
jgi:hypothetical protein